jgi:alpha-N-arabinofuranosidase
MRAINPALIRYPGGCFADGYHWQDGIGPRSQRPMRKNLAWSRLGKRIGPDEDNHFGTDEFLRLAAELKAEPELTANVGTGTAEEAAAWVEYVNGSQDSKWGSERARNGHPKPYGVKYWFIGNEITGKHELGWQTPTQYVETLKRYSQAMRRVDPGIKLLASGAYSASDRRESLHKAILSGAGEFFDYLSVHLYASNAVDPAHILRYQVLNQHQHASCEIYYDIMAALADQDDYLTCCARDARTYAPAHKKIPVSLDEWNLWYRCYSDLYQSNFNLRDGLWVASSLNMFHRYAPDLELANISQMVNCMGLIVSTPQGTFPTASALVFRIYTANAGDKLLPSKVDGPMLPHPAGIPVLDLSATRKADTLALFLVNRHLDAGLSCQCACPGLQVGTVARRVELYHPNAFLYNTFKNPTALKINKQTENLKVERNGPTSTFAIQLPPHSLTCLILEAKDL